MLDDGEALNFALYSKHAKSIELLLYKSPDFATPAATFRLHHLTNKSGPIWHCRVSTADSNGATTER